MGGDGTTYREIDPRKPRLFGKPGRSSDGVPAPPPGRPRPRPFAVPVALKYGRRVDPARTARGRATAR